MNHWHWVIALAGLAFPVQAFGQGRTADAAPLSVAGSVLWSIQPEGAASGSPHEMSALGGTTIGGGVSLARGLNRFASIDVGVRFRGPISQDNGITLSESVSWRETHREFAFDAVVVFPAHSDRAFHVEPSIGVTFVRGITDRTDVVSRSFFSGRPPQPEAGETLIDQWLGLASGLDGVLTVAPRVAVVPSLRLIGCLAGARPRPQTFGSATCSATSVSGCA